MTSYAIVRTKPCGCLVETEPYREPAPGEETTWRAPNGDTCRVVPAKLAESVAPVCDVHRVREAAVVQGGFFE